MADFTLGYSLITKKNKYDYEIVSDKPLRINQSGMMYITLNDFVSDRPPRKDYIIIYISSGEADAWFEGKQYHAQSGDVLLFKPGSQLKYRFYTHSQHYYIHFTGTTAETYLSECSLYHSGIYRVGSCPDFTSIVSKISFELINRNIYTEFHCNGLFIQLLGSIAAKLLNIDSSAASGINKIYPAISAMMSEFNVNHPLSYYADLCDMSVSYFKHLFVNSTDITPLNYITSIRLDNAMMMLNNNNNSIKEIAYAVGYNDPLYFSRLFKKKFGITPTEYIKKLKPKSHK